MMPCFFYVIIYRETPLITAAAFSPAPEYQYVCVYVVSRSHKSHEWGLHNQSQQQQSCCKRSAYSKYVYYYMVLVQCINISTCRFLSCTPNLQYILRQLVQKKCTKGRSDLGLVVISLWNASKQGGQESSYHIVVDIWGWNCGSSGYYLYWKQRRIGRKIPCISKRVYGLLH